MKASALIRSIIILLLLNIYHNSHSQDRSVEGYVTTFDSIPLIGAEVKVFSSKELFYTDSIGRFEISCQARDKIKVKAHGFATQKIRLNEKIKVAYVNLHLKSSPKSRETAIGYGHVKEADKLYAISSLEDDELGFSGYSNIYDLLDSQFPGVEVVNKQVIVRGQNSINYSSAALIVVNGVIEPNNVLDFLSPNDIKRIDILKDGSTSIYGARGASGVVLIETK